MDRFLSDGSYKEELKELADLTLGSLGVSSPIAHREIMYLADKGNTVAINTMADMVFYKNFPGEGGYDKAFELYMKAAGITVEGSRWKCSERSYPPAFWRIGYYLVNYKRESVLADCPAIDIIEEMSKYKRLSTALELAVSCLKYVKVSGAFNLAGRIMEKAGHEEEVFEALAGVIRECVSEKELAEGFKTGACLNMADCIEAADSFFREAASKGYVYACTNLAVREAEKIVDGRGSVDDYIQYLRLAADKYEPYAANRLGLFYINGEIKSGDRSKVFRERVDSVRAKEYFLKATGYPDVNSAWAYFNLIKYFHKDYIKDIDLLGKHMDEIKKLNPAVYDLAMEL